MQRSHSTIQKFNEDGLLVHPKGLCEADIELLLRQIPGLQSDSTAMAFEADGQTPRAIHGCHLTNVVCGALVRLPLILEIVNKLLLSDVYVYQFKINFKAAFTGDVWPWHQDYSFWSHDDGMPTAAAVTVGIFLDEVTEFNGPIFFIPGSHHRGCLDEPQVPEVSAAGEWQRNFSSRLTYQTNKSNVAELVESLGIVAPKGPRGTVLFFHSNIVHASPSNVSPSPRRIIFITYNSVSNMPCTLYRPEFLVSRNALPLSPLGAEALSNLGFRVGNG